MTCRRCGGLMVVEPICDATGMSISVEAQETRCLNCGNVEDSVIYTNRLDPPSTGTCPRHNIGVEIENG